MEAGKPNPALAAARVAQLQQENEQLREQLRSYAAQQTVVRGALSEAAGEKEAAVRIAHRVAVEERATRTAVEVQGSSIGFAVVLQIINLFVLLIIAIGMFVFLPREIQRYSGSTTTIATPGNQITVPR